MQNDAFKRFGKDLQDALVMPVNNYLSKKSAKKAHITGLPGLTVSGLDGCPPHNHSHQPSPQSHSGKDHSAPLSSSTSDSVSLHNFSLSTISKSSSEDSRSFSSSNGSFVGSLQSQQQQPSYFHPLSKGLKISTGAKALNFLKSPRSPASPSNKTGVVGRFPKEEQPALIHCPPSVASLDQFSKERHAWVLQCLSHGTAAAKGTGHGATSAGSSANTDILKTQTAWDTVEGYEEAGLHVPNAAPTEKSGYHNLNEATGLVFIKLMQVSNRASAKVFDIECNLRVGSAERSSHPTRSFKDNPGNTATMNEVFLFDVNAPSQLEIEVTGTPIATKFGTMAGFSNTQRVHLGQLQLDMPLESMDNSIRTFKLKRVQHPSTLTDGAASPATTTSTPHSSRTPTSLHAKEKTDCEIILMMGVHVLKEPVEDRTWETETLYQGNLTVMTRGTRRSAWKRYWAVLEGSAIKLYDAEYQLKRDPVATISLGHIQGVQLPDYDKVDVGANGFSIVLSQQAVDLSQKAELFEHDPLEFEQLEYHVYAFADSPFLHEVWNANLEEALEQYRENMVKRAEVALAKKNRRRLWALESAAASSTAAKKGGNCVGETIFEEDEEDQSEAGPLDLVDLRFVS
ncbi:hypothetical protein EMPS_10144 [Entomortierella parvispora]|uniref:PH domain-containing protein n=1 Tax=Entomortierella parvispora TaxID=205924 RepID=A0A9P3M197_9FUNG|nr:hypothetical protein EMPS_10144 [Entomortierella parvispora]